MDGVPVAVAAVADLGAGIYGLAHAANALDGTDAAVAGGRVHVCRLQM
jgi:hypothetical protein